MLLHIVCKDPVIITVGYKKVMNKPEYCPGVAFSLAKKIHCKKRRAMRRVRKIRRGGESNRQDQRDFLRRRKDLSRENQRFLNKDLELVLKVGGVKHIEMRKAHFRQKGSISKGTNTNKYVRYWKREAFDFLSS